MSGKKHQIEDIPVSALENQLDMDSDSNGKNEPMRDRQAKICPFVASKGFVTIDFLAQEFDVTPQTIRRDINTLSKKGLIHRYHE